MGYTGEHLLPGQLGHFFIVLSLVASLVATFAYYKAATDKGALIAGQLNDGLFAGIRSTTSAGYWRRLARWAFIIESISIFAIFSLLIYIITNHLFEYKYAWQHSNRSLPLKYLLAAIWEGQEGSFLLWSIWHCVLGLILIRTGKKWEAHVMTVISFAQVCLATMIAGMYIFGFKVGSNPFILLRDSGVLDNAPALHVNFDVNQPMRADYLASIKDGNGLNILLQNYWMVIHPPVLFFGFASTIVPFAYAVSGMWSRHYDGWIKPALPWALLSAAVFGVGIMMGAKWAHESLTFGGYWAWDPVENASLVPWMILVAGIHTLLIYKHSGHSLRATHLFFILSFGFVLYSTFLTRSGILGEASVHAFTDLGMNAQLYLFLIIFFWLGAIFSTNSFRQKIIYALSGFGLLLATLLLANYNAHLGGRALAPMVALFTPLTFIGFIIYNIQDQVPTLQKEESSSSREFWMFIGSLVFFLSAMVIIGQTSVPVYNKVFGINKAAPEDAEFSYNSIQVYVAVIVALLTAIGQYFKYKETSSAYFWKKILTPTIITLAIVAALFVFFRINYTKKGPVFHAALWLAVACSVYTIVANLSYIWIGLKGKLKLSGGSVSHFGFGLVLLGILISSSNKEVLSNNVSGIYIPLGDNEDPRENLTLVQGQRMDMGRYYITYVSDSFTKKDERTYFNIQFNRKDGKENFMLHPNSFINPKGQEGLSSNPDARHYWDHDVFTYITSLPNPEKMKDTAKFQAHTIRPGDSVFYSSGFMILQDVRTSKDSLPEELFGKDGSLHEAPLKIYSKTGSVYSVTPRFAIAKGAPLAIPDTITAESLVIQFQKLNPDQSIELGVKESDAVMKYITLKAYKFPYIRLLWWGVVITAIGILMSMVHRIQASRRKPSAT